MANVLPATELFAFTWFVLWYMNFTSMVKKEKENELGRKRNSGEDA